jgi:polysaccharide biosynthesis protein PelF
MRDQEALPPPQLFRSFWLAGFESSCHINRAGVRLDMLAAIQHDRQVDADYALLRSVGIHTVRDGIRWPLIERRSFFDFSSVAPMVVAAQRQGIQV